MEYLDPAMASSKKFKRRKEEMTTEEYNEFKRNYSSSKYPILRCEPKICKLIKKVHECELDLKEYPFVKKPDEYKKSKNNIKKKGAT
jgi:hypothetical protein